MKITILGATGCIGSSTAFNIAVHGLADELVLIGGSRQDALKQYVMDLTMATTTRDIRIRAGTYDDMAGSDIVIMSAGAHQGIVTSRMQFLTGNLPLLQDIGRKIAQLCPHAVVITVTNPVDPFNYALYLLSSHRDRRKFIGYSANDTFRFRMWAAEILNVSPHRVNGMVIGEHGEHQVMLYSSLKLDGKPVKVTEEFKQKIKDKVATILQTMEAFKASTGRTLGFTCAVGITSICNAIRHNTREVIPCSAVLDGEYGLRNFSLTVPAVIGKNGIHDIKVVKMSSEEQEELKNCIDFLGTYMKQMEENFNAKSK